MKQLIFFGLLFFLLSSRASTVPETVRHVCATGESQDGVQRISIPFQNVTEDDDYAGKYKANYSMFNGIKIGYAKKDALASIIYNRRLYPVSRAALLNVTKTEYQGMIEHGDVDLAQAADWSLLKTKNKEQYLCVALNKSMEKAIPLIYLLRLSTQPRQLFFSIENIKN